MEAPRRYSVSPYYSFVTVPSHRVSFVDALKAIIAWLRGTKPSRSENQLEQRIVDLLAEELEQNEPHIETSLTPIPPKRPRRLTGREDC
jgi:hypothetical protein